MNRKLRTHEIIRCMSSDCSIFYCSGGITLHSSVVNFVANFILLHGLLLLIWSLELFTLKLKSVDGICHMVAFAKTNLLLAISAIPSSLSFACFPNYAKRNVFFFAFSSYLTRARILDAYKVCRKFLYQQYIQIQIYSQATRKASFNNCQCFYSNWTLFEGHLRWFDWSHPPPWRFSLLFRI